VIRKTSSTIASFVVNTHATS